jgi:integrating conjugative element membrane protein (TIGR03747 family)
MHSANASSERGAPSKAPARSVQRGPITLVVGGVFGLIGAACLGAILGVALELVGMYFFWPEQGLAHCKNTLALDLAHIAKAPRSLLVDDTAGFAEAVVRAVEVPYRTLGILDFHARQSGAQQAGASAAVSASGAARSLSTLQRLTRRLLTQGVQAAVVSMVVVQDTALRLLVVVFALPGVLLACLLGSVDGLVRRDLRRFGGDRDKTGFHRLSKRSFSWVTTAGFMLYLLCPLQGVNPAYVVLGLTVLMGWSLSNALASYRKYF